MKYQVKLRHTAEIIQRCNNPQNQAPVKVCQHNNSEVCLLQTFQFKEFCPLSTNLKKMSLVPLKKLLQVKLCFLWAQRQTDTRGEIKGQTSRASKKSYENNQTWVLLYSCHARGHRAHSQPAWKRLLRINNSERYPGTCCGKFCSI